MSNHEDGSTQYPSVPANPLLPPGAPPSNVFTGDFLSRFDEEDEPPTASEAAVAGVGPVFPVPEGYAVYLPGESAERGHLPVAVFKERWQALLASAVLPGTGRDPLVRLKKDAVAGGYPLVGGLDADGEVEVVGHLRIFDESLAAALHAAEALVRSPECLAALLQAAGKVTLERAGTLLDLRVPAR
jgi:hypothetical protein